MTMPAKIEPGDGVTALYAFRSSQTVPIDQDEFTENVVSSGFGIAHVDVNSQQMIFVTGERLYDPEAMRAELAQVCAFQRPPKLILQSVQYVSIWASLLAEAEAARKRDADRERLKPVFEEWRREPPWRDDIDKALRFEWSTWSHEFHLDDTGFGRVRDSDCKYVDSHDVPHFDCVLGVTATSKRGPEYEQRLLHIQRLDDKSLKIFLPRPPAPSSPDQRPRI